jgi:hypothetical protein
VGLTSEEREYVIMAAVDLLRHHRRHQVMEVLRRRIELGDYPAGAEGEQDLDRLAYAIARAVDEQLAQ